MEEQNRRNDEFNTASESGRKVETDPQDFDKEAEEAKRAAEGAAGAGKSKKSWKQELREWIMAIAVALMIVFFIRGFLFQIIRVDGSSMSDTLENGERLFVTVYDVKFAAADRGDIVICHYPNRGKTNFVKRVVAVPGDEVYCEDGVTHVVYETVDENGETVTVDEALDEKFANSGYCLCEDYERYTLGEDQYFVVGDNRYNSHDSRSDDVGPITGDMIIGHVRTVIWPLNSIRSVDE